MLLSVLVFLPIVFALVVLAWPSERTLRPLALAFSLVEFGLSLTLFWRYDPTTAALQLVEQYPWMARFGVTYFFGIDGISLLLVVLTTFILPIIILGSWTSITQRVKTFHISLFVLQTAMLGTFLAMDAIFFYCFWELSLVPMYFMIGIWGGDRRIYATIKFFIFTMAGSVLMLLSIIYLMFLTEAQTGQISASLLDFYMLNIPFVAGSFLTPQALLFFSFALAFAIKVPMFPVHTWLPDAHTQAPTAGSVILAGVMLKMGTYGLLRWAIPIFPEAAEHWAWLFLMLGAIGIVYGALVAMIQPDMKKLVAYSSVSHMGYIVLGLFALNSYGITGGIYQMLNHGISTGGLFLMVGMIYDRTHSREIAKYGGVASVMPLFTIFFFIITLSSIAVPLTNGFIGEFLILMGGFQASPLFASVGVLGVVLGAGYMLWMFKRIFFGTPTEMMVDAAGKSKYPDLNLREMTVLTPLIILIFWMGIYPQSFLRWMDASVSHLVQNATNYNLVIYPEEIAPETSEVVYKEVNANGN